MTTDTKFLSPPELARRWGVSLKTIYNMMNRGDPSLPRHMRVGGRIRFSIDDVLAREESAMEAAAARMAGAGGRQ